MLRRPGAPKIVARAVAYQILDDLEAKVLLLAERDDGSGWSLEVQRGLEPDQDDPDELLPCFVIDAGPTYFGAPTTWRVDGVRVEIDLAPEAFDVLGTTLRVRLQDEATASKVRAALVHLLDDGPEAEEFIAGGWVVRRR